MGSDARPFALRSWQNKTDNRHMYFSRNILIGIRSVCTQSERMPYHLNVNERIHIASCVTIYIHTHTYTRISTINLIELPLLWKYVIDTYESQFNHRFGLNASLELISVVRSIVAIAAAVRINLNWCIGALSAAFFYLLFPFTSEWALCSEHIQAVAYRTAWSWHTIAWWWYYTTCLHCSRSITHTKNGEKNKLDQTHQQQFKNESRHSHFTSHDFMMPKMIEMHLDSLVFCIWLVFLHSKSLKIDQFWYGMMCCECVQIGYNVPRGKQLSKRSKAE